MRKHGPVTRLTPYVHLNPKACQVLSDAEAAIVNNGGQPDYNPHHLPVIPVKVDIQPKHVTWYETDVLTPWLLYPVKDVRIGTTSGLLVDWPRDGHEH